MNPKLAWESELVTAGSTLKVLTNRMPILFLPWPLELGRKGPSMRIESVRIIGF